MQPKLRLFSDGNHTYAELDGKSIGRGVEALNYSHDASGNIKMEIRLDLEKFKFEQDGFFDGAQKRYMEYEPHKEEVDEWPR